MIDAEERELLARTLAHATETSSGAALDDALSEIGWRHALAGDARTAVSLLFELQGRTGATSTALEILFAETLGCDPSSETSVVLPWIGGAEAPGNLGGDGVDVRGLGSSASPVGPVALVVCRAAEGQVSVAVRSEDLGRRPILGMDPDLGLVEITGAQAAVVSGPTPVVDQWTSSVALGRLALAHELIGASRTMLRLACDHAVERIQFGRPIASFQAVRHRLAEAYVAVETAQAAADGAWEEGSPGAAAAAKAIAGRSAREVARHSQQVLAGIGFTAEHPLHRHVRRILVLDGLLGDARSITRAMGEDLLGSRSLPPLLPL